MKYGKDSIDIPGGKGALILQGQALSGLLKPHQIPQLDSLLHSGFIQGKERLSRGFLKSFLLGLIYLHG
jgi:hypothetical protein